MRDFWRRKGPRTLPERLIVYGSFIIVPAFFIYAIVSSPEYEDVDGYNADVIYENGLGIPIRVFVDGHYEASLRVDESKPDAFFWCRRSCLVEATDREGRGVFSRRVTRGQIEAGGYRVVIADD